MAIGDRRLGRKVSTLTIFAASAAVTVTVAALASPPNLDTAGMALNTTAEPGLTSARCQEADRTAVGQIAVFLDRNGPTDAPVLERAVHTLNLARRHCLYDWEGRGLDDYRQLSRWLGDHS